MRPMAVIGLWKACHAADFESRLETPEAGSGADEEEASPPRCACVVHVDVKIFVVLCLFAKMCVIVFLAE